MTAVSATPVHPDATPAAGDASSTKRLWSGRQDPLAGLETRSGTEARVWLPESAEALDASVQERAVLFREGLGLPPNMLAGRSVGVLGSGGTVGVAALAFARWGAQVHFFDSDMARRSAVMSDVTEAFGRFGLMDSLVETVDPLSADGSGASYDFVSAETMLHGRDPVQDTLNGLKARCRPDGLVHVSCFSRRGTFVEAMIRALIAGVSAATDKTPGEVARTLMMIKWDRRGSARAFEAWIEGHLVNPAARGLSPIDGGDLCRRGIATGLRLQSSAPAYRDGLYREQSGQPSTVVEDIRRIDEHLSRAALGHALGLPLYYGGSLSGAGEIGALIDAAIGAAEDCAERAEPTRFQAAAAALRALTGLTRQCSMWVGRSGSEAAGSLLTGLSAAFDAVATGDTAAVDGFCRENTSFQALWGTPVHHILFRRDETLDGLPRFGDYPEDQTPGRARPA
ncbi:MAG: hypothetical protein ACFB6R_05655 [Alphaproteobacteria bacterium]